ncbi:MAG: hypothetical protein KAS12_03270 [Candidatus Aenigmarchaeota archaeon]|nr:hypothetical protein [Candidatus Aenigmarchaeota archaeon]
MIIPTKHITVENSLLGVGAEILKRLERPKTVSTLWEQSKFIKGVKTYGMFTLTLDFMFMIGIIKFSNGFLRRTK